MMSDISSEYEVRKDNRFVTLVERSTGTTVFRQEVAESKEELETNMYELGLWIDWFNRTTRQDKS